MSNENNQSMTVNEIIKKVKQEAQSRQPKESNEVEELTIAPDSSIDDRQIKKVEVPSHLINTEPTLEEFSPYYDEEFIDYAYQRLLKRFPDSNGKELYLSMLRNGTHSKNEIIAILAFSSEASQYQINTKPFRWQYYASKVSKVPLLGYWFKLMINLFTLPKLINRLNSYENHAIHEVKSHHKILENQFINLKQSNNSLISKLKKENRQIINENQQIIEESQNIRNYMKMTEEKIQGFLEEARQKTVDTAKQTSNHGSVRYSPADSNRISVESHQYDRFYAEFESRFRGEKADIKQRLKVYLPYLEPYNNQSEKPKVLDIGCGRGEWLDLLKDQGYEPIGIDINRYMIADLQSKGFEVYETDAIKYLKSLDDNSIQMITGFHIIEHLAFETLMKLFEECHRVLTEEGMVIFETPNPENVLVGSQYFYQDPTHLNPLVPSTIQFILEYHQYNHVKIKRLHKYTDYFNKDGSTELENDAFNLFADKHIYNEMDYAIIGYKS